MKYRLFPKSNQKISEIGHGTWGMGSMWGPRNDRQSIDALVYSLSHGVNFIDTAWIYGEGHSESLIASALKEAKTKSIFIASKVPPKNLQWPARHHISVKEAFPLEHIIEYTEKTLINLRKEQIDLQQLHVWSDNWLEEQDWPKIIDQLKTSGKVKYFGISINDHEPNSALRMVESGLIDSIQVIYNIFDQSPEEKLLPLCQKHNVAVIARVPFDEGSLTGQLSPTTTFHKKDWRKHYFTPERLKDIELRLKPIQEIANENNFTLPQLALKFCLSHPAVTTVIPGMRKLNHVKNNLSVAELPDLSKNCTNELKKQKWLRNFYPKHG